ncbi:MAG: ABC transporter permease [Spirochaetales bacterium]|uniref:ABC transporter permease n=1 Tax=Candidatus Thalassospirochaeta sargassi TaxID=3119039 RepID=A0AAJ1ICX9_9SPIO|nr:ABC transporter permease [Spirochaetales bacterium]
MKITEGLRESISVMGGNKIRAVLTILGINFGVGCLIAISVIGLAFRDSVGSEVGRYGSTLLWVQVDGNSYLKGESRILMDGRDIKFFKQALPGLQSSGTLFSETYTAAYMGESKEAQVLGVGPGHFEMFDSKIEKGRTFIEQDISLRKRVCVIRPDIAARLFKDEDPLGKVIRLSERNYTVIGVTERANNMLLSDGSDNNTIFIPDSLVGAKIWGGNFVKYWIYLFKFDSIENVEIAEERINSYLEKKYGLLRDLPRFRVQRLDSFVGMIDRILNIITTLVTVIAAISIVVGGLGIMNIMLVAVTERTREIGIRMAVGATKTDIVVQFIIEAIVLCLIGGATGVFFGAVLAAVVCSILEWKFMLSFVIVAGALGISTFIGLVFGIYPAWKASRLMPVEALRSDA